MKILLLQYNGAQKCSKFQVEHIYMDFENLELIYGHNNTVIKGLIKVS